jgi:hypothetical protein
MFFDVDGRKSIRISVSGEGECSLRQKERSVPLSLNLSPKLILATPSTHPDAPGIVPLAF